MRGFDAIVEPHFNGQGGLHLNGCTETIGLVSAGTVESFVLYM